MPKLPEDPRDTDDPIAKDTGASAAAPELDEDPSAPEGKEPEKEEKLLGDSYPGLHTLPPSAPPAEDLAPEIAKTGHGAAQAHSVAAATAPPVEAPNPGMAETAHEEAHSVAAASVSIAERSIPLPIVVAIKKQTETSGKSVKIKLTGVNRDDGQARVLQFMSSLDPTHLKALSSMGFEMCKYAPKSGAAAYAFSHVGGEDRAHSISFDRTNMVFIFGSKPPVINQLLNKLNSDGGNLYTVHSDDTKGIVLRPFVRGEPLSEENLLAALENLKDADITATEALLDAATLKMTYTPTPDKTATSESASASLTRSTGDIRAMGGAGDPSALRSFVAPIQRFFGGSKDKTSPSLPSKDAKDTPPEIKKPK
jgi:hypothetical protein